MEHLIANVVSPLLITGLQGLAVVLLALGTRYLHKKTGIKINQGTQQLAEAAALRSVMAVEEIAERKIKETGSKMLSETKHGQAIDLLLAAVPAISQGQASNMVTWAVANVMGLGATANKLGK